MAILETFPSRDNSHTILNDSGTAVAKEDNLQFVGFDVTDDSTNNKTKVKAAGLNSDSLDDVCNGEISSAFAQTGLCYSTEEQIVGKWIDGSIIYQKSGTYTVTSNYPTGVGGMAEMPISLPNFNKLIKVEGACTAGSNIEVTLPLGGVSDVAGTISFGRVTDSYVQLRIGGTQNLGIGAIVRFTVQYTKTS